MYKLCSQVQASALLYETLVKTSQCTPLPLDSQHTGHKYLDIFSVDIHDRGVTL